MAITKKSKRPPRGSALHPNGQSPWESGALGLSDEHVVVASPDVEAARIDDRDIRWRQVQVRRVAAGRIDANIIWQGTCAVN